MLAPKEFFTFMYLLDLYTVQQSMPAQLPAGIFPPGIHLALQAAALPVPISLRPTNVEHVPLQQQNPVENLALQAEGTSPNCCLMTPRTLCCIHCSCVCLRL